MPSSNDKLKELILSLDRSEKKQVRLFISRHLRRKENRLLKIFSFYSSFRNENSPSQKLPAALRKKHFPSEKLRLYRLILRALSHSKKNISIGAKMSEDLLHAEILNAKGLRPHALGLLGKTRKTGLLHQELGGILRALELEQEIYRTSPGSLILGAARESIRVLEDLKLSVTWKEFYLRVHILSLEYSGTRNPEIMEVLQSMIRNQPERSLFTWPFYAKLYHAFAFSDYFLLIGDTWNSSLHLRAALEQLLAYPEISRLQPGLLLGTSSGLMGTLLDLGEFEQTLDLSSRLRDLSARIFNPKDKRLALQLFCDTEPYELQALTMLKRPKEAMELAENIERKLEKHDKDIDPPQRIRFHRSLAKAWYSAGDPGRAFRHMDSVFRDETGRYSPDNIFYLVLSYELKQFAELPDRVALMRRLLISRKRLHKVEFLMMELFMKLSRTPVVRDHLFFFEEALHELDHADKDKHYQLAMNSFNSREWILQKISALQEARK